MNATNSAPLSGARYNALLYKLSLFLTCWTFLVVLLGGTVKSHEAGLSIPEAFIFHWINDWWKTPNLKWEFAHRMFVSGLGAGVFVLMVLTLMWEQRPRVRKFSVWLMVSVIVQAIVGYLTVDRFAHPQTSIPHAALGHSFLAMMAIMTTVQSPSWLSDQPAFQEKQSTSLRKLALWNLIAVFVQLLLGAALRHDDHGKAMLNDREWVFYSHLAAHIMGATAVCYYLSMLLIRVLRDHREQPELLGPAKKIMMLVGVQLFLGMGAAMLKIFYAYSEDAARFADAPPAPRIWVATAHVAVGALILLYSSVMAVRTYRYVLPHEAGETAKQALRPGTILEAKA